jgi:hypothetical protein
VLAAIPAALAISLTAPASAAPSSVQSTVGTAWDNFAFTGNTASLQSGATDCTRIFSDGRTAHSAQNNLGSGSTITLYRTTDCSDQGLTLQPGVALPVISRVSYKST